MWKKGGRETTPRLTRIHHDARLRAIESPSRRAAAETARRSSLVNRPSDRCTRRESIAKSLAIRTVDFRGSPTTDQSPSNTSKSSRGSRVVTRATRRSTSSAAKMTPGRRLPENKSLNGNSTTITSPGLKLVIGNVVWRFVLEKFLQGRLLPIEILRRTTHEMGKVTIEPDLVSERQRLNRLLYFLDGGHGVVFPVGCN